MGVRKFSGFAKSMEGVAVQENATAPGSAPFLGFSTAAAPTSRSATLDADFSTGARSVTEGTRASTACTSVETFATRSSPTWYCTVNRYSVSSAIALDTPSGTAGPPRASASFSFTAAGHPPVPGALAYRRSISVASLEPSAGSGA